MLWNHISHEEWRQRKEAYQKGSIPAPTVKNLTRGSIRGTFLYILFLIAAFALILGIAWYATSKHVWYAGTDQYQKGR